MAEEYYETHMDDFRKVKYNYQKIGSTEMAEAKLLMPEKNHIVEFIVPHREKIKSLIALNASVKSLKEALPLIYKIDMKKFFPDVHENCTDFECRLLGEQYIGSVNCDDKGNYKYFSRSVNNKEHFWLDLIDIFEIVFHFNYFKAVLEITELAGIEIETISPILKVYSNNIQAIEDKREVFAEYPELYKYINRHLYLLTEINLIGLDNFLSDRQLYNGSNVFFASSRYIADRLAQKGKKITFSVVNRLINTFCLLGFIRKVPEPDIPECLLIQMKKCKKEKRYNDNDYFVVNKIDYGLLSQAESVVTKLIQANISATKVSLSLIKNLLPSDRIALAYNVKKKIVKKSKLAAKADIETI